MGRSPEPNGFTLLTTYFSFTVLILLGNTARKKKLFFSPEFIFIIFILRKIPTEKIYLNLKNKKKKNFLFLFFFISHTHRPPPRHLPRRHHLGPKTNQVKKIIIIIIINKKKFKKKKKS
jgi:hypothetical protein